VIQRYISIVKSLLHEMTEGRYRGVMDERCRLKHNSFVLGQWTCDLRRQIRRSKSVLPPAHAGYAGRTQRVNIRESDMSEALAKRLLC
jgi:hypothetical protein